MTIETRPSAAHRWTKCSAAPLFASRAGPQPTSDPAREGTCAAWVAELLLTDQPVEVGMMHRGHSGSGLQLRLQSQQKPTCVVPT